MLHIDVSFYSSQNTNHSILQASEAATPFGEMESDDSFSLDDEQVNIFLDEPSSTLLSKHVHDTIVPESPSSSLLSKHVYDTIVPESAKSAHLVLPQSTIKRRLPQTTATSDHQKAAKYISIMPKPNYVEHPTSMPQVLNDPFISGIEEPTTTRRAMPPTTTQLLGKSSINLPHVSHGSSPGAHASSSVAHGSSPVVPGLGTVSTSGTAIGADANEPSPSKIRQARDKASNYTIFAVNLFRKLFSEKEFSGRNVNGRSGKEKLEESKMAIIRKNCFHVFSPDQKRAA
jgi:hypothetical protein